MSMINDKDVRFTQLFLFYVIKSAIFRIEFYIIGDSISAGLATIQQLTQKMKQEAQEISSERQRIKHAFNRGIDFPTYIDLN